MLLTVLNGGIDNMGHMNVYSFVDPRSGEFGTEYSFSDIREAMQVANELEMDERFIRHKLIAFPPKPTHVFQQEQIGNDIPW